MTGKFSADVKRFVADAKVATTTQMRAAILELFRRVILKTPVDTGRARANWQFFMGTPSPSQSDSTDPSGSGAIQAVQNGLSRMQPGETVWLANNLPYITVLEYGGYPDPAKTGTKTTGGYSKQAPAGMVRVTVAEFSGRGRRG